MWFRMLMPLVWAAQGQTPSPGPDSLPTYASLALQALVARAAHRNSVVPPGLESYDVTAESELSLVARRANGTEGATQVEQVESRARWLRNGAFAQHIIGYRSQLSGPNVSALGLIKQAWIVPVLYGNRLGLFLGRDTLRAARRTIARDTAVRVVHPFAADRDAIYGFTRGDTAVQLVVSGRTIPIAIVHVTPRHRPQRRTVVFRGDVYVDMDDGTIVRMRGAFETVGGHSSFARTMESFAYHGAAFIDLTNREVDGRYWLPNVERIEGEVSSPFMGDARSVFRIISHFGPYSLNDTTPVPGAVATSPQAFSPGSPVAPLIPGVSQRTGVDSVAVDSALATDTLHVLPHVLSIAPSDSLTAFSDWRQPIGVATRAVQDSDFSNVAPDQWRTTGAPRVQLGARHVGDFLHFDRVEGLYTGAGASLRLRDAAPGVTVRAHAGWAWTEETARGGGSVEWQSGTWLLGAQASRTLDITNDFTTAYSNGPFLESLVVEDDYDYVDRRGATVYALHEWLSAGGSSRVRLRVEGGPENDQGDRARLTHGIFSPSVFMDDSLFRPNRNVLAGSYLLGAVTLDYNPGIDAGFVGQGVGARIRYEAAGGQLAWERVDARVVVRHTWGPFTALGRMDAGVVNGTVIPPQQLYQIGSVEGLLAYDYKQFAGNEAAVWQGEGWYALPLWQAPLRVRGFYFPSPSPALAVGFQSGWTTLTTLAAHRALTALGARVNPGTNAVLRDSLGMPLPLGQPTNGLRTSVNVLIRFFGGAAGIGVTRSLDPGARVQAIVRLGATV